MSVTPRSFQMAKSQKTVLALPQREGVETAASAPVLRPNLKHGSLDHPHHERIRRPTQCLCGPTSTPTAKSSKKPKMQATGDMFPTNWSPPPVEFLTPRARQAGKRAQACRWVGTVGPQSLRRLACWVPSELEQKSQVSDPQGNLASLEELFWNTAGPSQEAAAPLLTPGDSESYINSLDYLLQEKREQALEQEQEKLLAQGCPDLESLDLDEEDLPLTPEHRSPLAQQLSFLRGGLLSNLYLQAPAPTCPVPLLQWLFQLLTWPPETSSRAFGLLWDLSVDRLFCQSDGDVCMWCPSLREIIEVFHSLGAHSPALYPPGPSQQSERVFKREASLSQGEQQDTPQETALDISLSYIYKFLTLCALVQPGFTTDENLLDLIELLCRAGLDVRLRLLPQTDLQQLLLLLLENIQEWPGKLQQLCSALSLVSDHHHNLLALVQFFLDVTSRSRQLRSQLSLVVIARLLDQQETLSLWQEKAQLVELSRLLSLMRPSSLGLYLDSETLPPCQEQQPKASAELDHKVCYLCHSLLTLAGVVVSCQDITPDQWGELQLLCLQLDCHISTHIRESPQAMHRTKLKDLAAQTYIRWQELLSHCQPQAQYCRPWEDV
ncbi:family with sequence similarity 178 member B [Phyllostomus discolor]|uniref:Family with sequence similarity 178 member B n=1 Tax=Phyllostomus discolor TaxID=89673 RepID=A0A834A0F2_9CHIR|nr:family with sequence similarity 178 member B [Phyllostomus discolor]